MLPIMYNAVGPSAQFWSLSLKDGSHMKQENLGTGKQEESAAFGLYVFLSVLGLGVIMIAWLIATGGK